MWMDPQIDRQTDMMKLIVTFHNFGNTSKNILIVYSYKYPTIVGVCGSAVG